MTHDGKLPCSLRYVSPCLMLRPDVVLRFSPCDSANFSSLQGSLDLHDEKALQTRRCPRRPSTRTYEAEFTMPQPSANANQQRGQDYNRVGNLSGRYSASNNAGASNGGLTQRAVHNQPKAQRDGAEPARLRMVCGDCCLPSCYVKERVKMALAQQLDVATSGECVAVLTCPPYGGPFCLPYVPASRAACPEACTRASLWRAAGGTLDGSVKLYSLLAYTHRYVVVKCTSAECPMGGQLHRECYDKLEERCLPALTRGAIGMSAAAVPY